MEQDPTERDSGSSVGSGPDAADQHFWLGRLAAFISNLGGVLAGISIVAILVLISTEIVLRQFRSSLLVTDEIGGYLNAAVVFLGLGYTLRNGGFIRVELVYDALSAGLRKAAAWSFVMISTVFVSLLLYVAIKHVRYAFVQDTRAVSVLETPEWIPQCAMVAGLAILLLQLVTYIIDRVRNVP